MNTRTCLLIAILSSSSLVVANKVDIEMNLKAITNVLTWLETQSDKNISFSPLIIGKEVDKHGYQKVLFLIEKKKGEDDEIFSDPFRSVEGIHDMQTLSLLPDALSKKPGGFKAVLQTNKTALEQLLASTYSNAPITNK